MTFPHMITIGTTSRANPRTATFAGWRTRQLLERMVRRRNRIFQVFRHRLNGGRPSVVSESRFTLGTVVVV